MSLHSRVASVHVLLLLGLATACGSAVQTTEDTDAETTGDAEPATSSSTAPTGSGPAGTTSTGPEPDGSTTLEPDADTSSSSSEEGGFIDAPDAGTPLPGICVGLTEIGFLGTVHRGGETPVDTACTSTPAPCGGDPVGAWTIESNCGLDGLPNFFAGDCPESTMTFLASEVSGTRTFDEDGSFATDSTLSLDVELQLPAMECFGIDCETFGQALSGEDNLDASCADAPEGDACVCLLTITNDLSAEGTWSVEDESLTLTVNGQPGDPLPFCVEDDRLALWEALHESQAYPETPCADAMDCADALGDEHDEWICVE